MKVTYLEVDTEVSGQRVDNFIMAQFRSVPKSHIYRVLRKGEVRVNKKRVKPDYRLLAGDVVRIPPIRHDKNPIPSISARIQSVIEEQIVFEDPHVLVLNKPSGMAVHGGSGLSFGVIEAMRQKRPECSQLELVHRLDKETSGCLILAKKRSVLRSLHEQFRQGDIKKTYLALTLGLWKPKSQTLTSALKKNVLQSGERIVCVDEQGKPAKTFVTVLNQFVTSSLVKLNPYTGRTHQLRVHTAHENHPIAGDDKYGNDEFNKDMRALGLNRLFLHAHEIEFVHPKSAKIVKVTVPMEFGLNKMIELLKKRVNFEI